MSSLFIMGNGFDIAHGMPTTYNHFRTFVIERFPNALKLRDQIVYLEDLNKIDPDEFAAEILLNAMDKSAGKNWCNFEEALAYVNFNSKLPMAKHKQNETDEEDCKLIEKYLLYIGALTSRFISCSKIWQEFFRLWIKEIEILLENGNFSSKQTLKELFSQSDACFLTFNYTKTLQELYGIKKVVHIHNRAGQKLVFGHGKKDATYGENMDGFFEGPLIGSSFLDDMIQSFEKNTERPLRKYRDFFEKLDESIDKVYSYGFSYGKVDSIYIKKVIEKISPNARWYFTSYEAMNPKELRIKKVKLRRYGFRGIFDVYEGG